MKALSIQELASQAAKSHLDGFWCRDLLSRPVSSYSTTIWQTIHKRQGERCELAAAPNHDTFCRASPGAKGQHDWTGWSNMVLPRPSLWAREVQEAVPQFIAKDV